MAKLAETIARLKREQEGKLVQGLPAPIGQLIRDIFDVFGSDTKVTHRVLNGKPTPACAECATREGVARIILEDGRALCSRCGAS